MAPDVKEVLPVLVEMATRGDPSRRSIAIHGLENLVSSDKGKVQLRRLYKTQLETIAAGGDPINVVREPRLDRVIETHAWNTVTTMEVVA